MIIKFDDFRPVTFDDKALFLSHYERFPQIHSDNTFTNIMCWNHFAHYRYAHVMDNILISSTIEGKTKFRPPIGPRNRELLKKVFHLAVMEGDDHPLVLVDDETKTWILEEYPDLPLHHDRNYSEYVYSTQDLADLPGKRYVNIRSHLNRFKRNCNPIVEEIQEHNLPEIREFLLEWCEWKDCDSEPFLQYEKDATLFALSHFTDLDLSGLLIRVAGKVGAIALFEIMNASTAVVHFEKGLPDCEGIYKAINVETAKYLRGKADYINRESDMGVPGLRKSKTRYRPHHMVEVYYAKKEDLVKLV